MMHNPPHLGEFLREICLEPLELTVTDAAKKLGIMRKALSQLLNGKSGISTEMSLRLAKAFNTTPESWLTQQMHYDLWLEWQKENDLGVSHLWKG
jgi:addiction module HigA family antidote